MDSLLVIAQSSSWLDAAWWWAVGRVCLGLGFVIFVHELGHFLVAKACGVKCEKFYIGFDFFEFKIGDMVLIPRALVKYQWGETEYGIGVLPLGGYVKMLGQDDNPNNIEAENERSQISAADENHTDAVGTGGQEILDPRSFRAKSVLQRMAIISAGVVFNLVFAVVFAAIALKSGVDFEPAIVGSVTPGGPAWEANLFGADVTKIGDTETDGYYRFIDLAQEVALKGENQKIDLEYRLPNSAETRTATVVPRMGLSDRLDLALIGFSPATAPRVASTKNYTVAGHPAASADPAFATKDLIVEVGGEKINNVFDLKRILAQRSDEELDFVVERQTDEKTERLSIQVGANRQRESGLVMKWGPVEALQKDSPAIAAGIQIGDVIVSIDGMVVGDLFTAEQRLMRLAKSKQDISLKVLREGATEELTIKPRVPRYITSIDPKQPVALNSIGVAVRSTRIIANAGPDMIFVGDEITKVEFVVDDPVQKEIFEAVAVNTTVEFEDDEGWESIFPVLQQLPPGFEFRVFWRTSGVEGKANGGTVTSKGLVLTTKASDEFFLPTRGVRLSLMQEHYQSQTWQDAFALGVHQTQWDASRVFQFLTKLVRGQISPKNLGGPGMIAVAATSEATQGSSRLLLFLTLLSANLAIVNFLPIPVLDGGHMVFLAYEGLFRQPPNEQVQILLTWAGLFMILGLMLYVIMLDIQRFTGIF